MFIKHVLEYIDWMVLKVMKTNLMLDTKVVLLRCRLLTLNVFRCPISESRLCLKTARVSMTLSFIWQIYLHYY